MLMRMRLLAAAILLTLLPVLLPGTAAAQDSLDPCRVNGLTARCANSASGKIYVPPDATLTSGSHRKFGRPICYDSNIKEGDPRYIVVCDGGPLGTWSNSLGCWLKLEKDQPKSEDPIWNKYPTGGKFYSCQRASGNTTVGAPAPTEVWLPAPPPVLVDPNGWPTRFWQR